MNTYKINIQPPPPPPTRCGVCYMALTDFVHLNLISKFNAPQLEFLDPPLICSERPIKYYMYICRDFSTIYFCPETYKNYIFPESPVFSENKNIKTPVLAFFYLEKLRIKACPSSLRKTQFFAKFIEKTVPYAYHILNIIQS